MTRRDTFGPAAVARLALAAALAAPAFARASVIDGVQAVSADQPQIHFYLTNATSTDPLVATVDDDTSIDVQAYLDTGASGILLSPETAAAFGLAEQTYNGKTINYNDTGVAGGETFGVSAPVRLALAPLLGTSNDGNYGGAPPTLDQYGPLSAAVRIQISRTPTDDLIGPLDIVGTPVLGGKVVVIDARQLNTFLASADFSEGDTLHTYAYAPGTAFKPATIDTDPGVPTVNHHVRLSMTNFGRFTSVDPAGAPSPSIGLNPVIGPDPVMKFLGRTQTNAPPPVSMSMNTSAGTKVATGSFLLDTGAQASFISVAEAAALGVYYRAGTEDTDNPVLVDAAGNVIPNQYSLAVGGVGGAITSAGFYLSSLTLPTTEGDPLTFTNAPVLVTDVTVTDPTTGKSLTLDGDLGMNYLVASYSADLNNGVGGSFNWITYDQTNGVLGLDLIGYAAPTPVAVAAGQTYTFDANPGTGVYARTVPGVTIAATGKAVVPTATLHANRQLIVVTGTGLSIAGATNAWTGRLDVGNNDLDLPGASLATVTNQVAQGFARGTWNGSGGIVSSAAAADPKHLYALGVIQNNQSGSALYTAANPFDGTTPGAADVLVKFTYYGDANLDGVVNGLDYSRIDVGFAARGTATPLTGWYNGDFNYDGKLDASDYTLIDNAFNLQKGNLSTAAVTAEVAGGSAAVPEPAAMGLLVTTAMSLVARRRSNTLARP